MRAVQKLIMLVDNAIIEYNNLEVTQVTKQYGVKEGIKHFEEAGVNAVLKELQQLHDHKLLSIIMDPKQVTRDMMQQALPYLVFLKDKRDTSIKGQRCADGQ